MGKYPKVEGSSMVWKVANINNYIVLLPIIFFTQVQITPRHMGSITHDDTPFMTIQLGADHLEQRPLWWAILYYMKLVDYV